MSNKPKSGSKASPVPLSLTELDEYGRKLLSDLEPPAGAADRLSRKVIAAESWAEQAGETAEAKPSRGWLRHLRPAMEVMGHGLPARKKASRKKKAAKAAKSRGKARKRSRKSPKRK